MRKNNKQKKHNGMRKEEKKSKAQEALEALSKINIKKNPRQRTITELLMTEEQRNKMLQRFTREPYSDGGYVKFILINIDQTKDARGREDLQSFRKWISNKLPKGKNIRKKNKKKEEDYTDSQSVGAMAQFIPSDYGNWAHIFICKEFQEEGKKRLTEATFDSKCFEVAYATSAPPVPSLVINLKEEHLQSSQTGYDIIDIMNGVVDRNELSESIKPIGFKYFSGEWKVDGNEMRAQPKFRIFFNDIDALIKWKLAAPEVEIHGTKLGFNGGFFSNADVKKSGKKLGTYERMILCRGNEYDKPRPLIYERIEGTMREANIPLEGTEILPILKEPSDISKGDFIILFDSAKSANKAWERLKMKKLTTTSTADAMKFCFQKPAVGYNYHHGKAMEEILPTWKQAYPKNPKGKKQKHKSKENQTIDLTNDMPSGKLEVRIADLEAQLTVKEIMNTKKKEITKYQNSKHNTRRWLKASTNSSRWWSTTYHSRSPNLSKTTKMKKRMRKPWISSKETKRDKNAKKKGICLKKNEQKKKQIKNCYSARLNGKKPQYINQEKKKKKNSKGTARKKNEQVVIRCQSVTSYITSKIQNEINKDDGIT